MRVDGVEPVRKERLLKFQANKSKLPVKLNKFFKLVERSGVKRCVELCQQAHIYEIEKAKDLRETLYYDSDKENQEFKDFFLPSRTMFVGPLFETVYVLFQDCLDEAMGWDCRREIIIFNLLEKPFIGYQMNYGFIENGEFDADIASVTSTTYKDLNTMFLKEPEHSAFREGMSDEEKDGIRDYGETMTAVIFTAAKQIHDEITHTKKFVLSRMARTFSHRKTPKGRIKRTEQRPVYITKTAGEAMEILGSKQGSTKRGHYRRRHLRRIQSGRIVNVKASWIGPQEATVGNQKYVVRLDL